MAYRKPVSVSLPPPLLKEVERRAKRQHQTFSELVRTALRYYLDDSAAREAAWKRTLAYGTKKAKELGIRTEEDVYAVMQELRHGPSPTVHATSRRR